MNFEILIELPPKFKNLQKCTFLILMVIYFFKYIDKLYTIFVISIAYFQLLAKKRVFLHHKFVIKPYKGDIFL